MKAGKRPRTLGRAVTVAAILAAGLMLAGCGGLIGSYLGTQQALRDAGYQSVSVHFTSPGRVTGRTSMWRSPPRPPRPTSADVASVVWRPRASSASGFSP